MSFPVLCSFQVDLSSLKDTVPTDKIVTLYGGWGLFGKRSSGEVLLRLTYKAYVEDEEDEGVKTEYATGYISDEDVLDYVRIDGGAKQQGDFNGNERETFMDLLAALLVSEEFQGIVSSAETRGSRESSEQVKEANAGDSVAAGKTATDAGTTASSSPEGEWMTAYLFHVSVGQELISNSFFCV
jgi:hypothetical protein